MVRRCVTTLRLRSVRLTLWRARLAADLVLAIADQKLLECGRSRAQLDCQPEKAPASLLVSVALRRKRYNRLFDASLVFCRSAASAPLIRICSTVSVAEADVVAI